MITVYYSIAADPQGIRERQWALSVRSLRRHNPDINVVLCLYGEASQETLAAARAADVHVLLMGELVGALGDVPRHWRDALSANRTLHKLLSLRGLLASDGLARLVYLDCDTYFFGDVAGLAQRYDRCDWYAREEYLNEEALAGIASAEGLISIPPYNTGVIVMSAQLARTLVTLLDDFLWYAWRLLVGVCLWQPQLLGDDALTQFVRTSAGAGERRLALRYPCDNVWILEEVATWLTLGRVPGLTHDRLRPPDVLQGDECIALPGNATVAHYFTYAEARFLAQLPGPS
jgi:hypothetical protein